MISPGQQHGSRASIRGQSYPTERTSMHLKLTDGSNAWPEAKEVLPYPEEPLEVCHCYSDKRIGFAMVTHQPTMANGFARGLSRLSLSMSLSAIRPNLVLAACTSASMKKCSRSRLALPVQKQLKCFFAYIEAQSYVSLPNSLPLRHATSGKESCLGQRILST